MERRRWAQWALTEEGEELLDLTLGKVTGGACAPQLRLLFREVLAAAAHGWPIIIAATVEQLAGAQMTGAGFYAIGARAPRARLAHEAALLAAVGSVAGGM